MCYDMNETKKYHDKVKEGRCWIGSKRGCLYWGTPDAYKDKGQILKIERLNEILQMNAEAPSNYPLTQICDSGIQALTLQDSDQTEITYLKMFIAEVLLAITPARWTAINVTRPSYIHRASSLRFRSPLSSKSRWSRIVKHLRNT